jgi:hypothetical protein
VAAAAAAGAAVGRGRWRSPRHHRRPRSPPHLLRSIHHDQNRTHSARQCRVISDDRDHGLINISPGSGAASWIRPWDWPSSANSRAPCGAVGEGAHRVAVTCKHIRVRVEIMGAPKCRNVRESQSVLIMIDPILSTRTRINTPRSRISESLAHHPRSTSFCDQATGEDARTHVLARAVRLSVRHPLVADRLAGRGDSKEPAGAVDVYIMRRTEHTAHVNIEQSQPTGIMVSLISHLAR